VEAVATSSSPSELGGVKGQGEWEKGLNPFPLSPFPSPHLAFLGWQTTRPMCSVALARAESSVKGSTEVTVWLRFRALIGIFIDSEFFFIVYSQLQINFT